MNARSIITIAIVGLLLIVAFQNMDDIVLSFLFWQIRAPQLLILPAVFLLGVAIGALVSRSGKKTDKGGEKLEAGSRKQDGG